LSNWAPKRFWQQSEAVACEGGFSVMLDGRAVKTPAKKPLIVPSLAMAQAIAVEWQAQQDKIKPETMPFTRSANSALDKVAVQFDEVAGLIAAYGGSDLLCYRAPHPQALTERQATAWDPLLQWAADELGAPLHIGPGIVPVAQPAGSLAALSAKVQGLTSFELAGFHDLVAISGSLVLGFAVAHRRLEVDEAWAISRIDETWQIEQWGFDEEAAESEAVRQAGMVHAARFYQLCR
jgi:chaperone required for assembly of F1-ATPase